MEFLDLTRTLVQMDDALKRMRILKTLVLHRARIANVDAFQGLAGLESLNLWKTAVENLDSLKDFDRSEGT